MKSYLRGDIVLSRCGIVELLLITLSNLVESMKWDWSVLRLYWDIFKR